MQRLVMFALVAVLILPFAGCLGENESNTTASTRTLDIKWTEIPLEAKSEYYSDEEAVSWQLSSDLVEEDIENAGGIIVGISMLLDYPNEDESPNVGLCTGLEDNVEDIIYGTVSKNDWTLTQNDVNPGSHVVNLTWHNQSLLEMENISGMSDDEIMQQIDFGMDAYGTYDFTIIVDADAFNGNFCTHTDNGEQVSSSISLLVLDVTIEGNSDVASLTVGDGTVSIVLFAPWFVGMFLLVGYLVSRKERYHLGIILDEESNVEMKASSSEGKTLVESYRARVLTLCALYVAQGIPWGFITVTFVTYLAVEGVAAGQLAFLLTLGTLPWSVKFLWGPIIDRFQFPEMGKRRPWILIAQSGMIVVLSSMLLIPNMSSNVTVVGVMFLVYNIFTALQDVSTDALAVDVLEPHEFEKVNSYMFTSKAVGGIIGGAGLGTIIGFVGIKGAIVLQIPILVVIMLVPLFMTERPGEKLYPWSESTKSDVEEQTIEQKNFKEIFNNIKIAFSFRSAQLGVLLSLIISLSYFLIPILPLLFVRELGWTEEQFNATKGGVILIVTMLGYMVGGQLGKQFGGKAIIIYAAFSTALITTFWGMNESLWSNGLFMMTVWSLQTFVWAMVSINIYSLMMRITWTEVGGTQFTGYMAMMNLSAIIGYQLTAPLAARFDYSTLFYIAALLETVVILGAMFIDPEETRREMAERVSV
ncbi:MAG TPA: MFS transporter [Candidatus Poseidoniaceae archaeon]|nr:MAG TPA: MFS transporter [Candidatus Poseidoniales archaeon]HII30504.1 MFS transporter [Candidatus Poseidoniaceae archaeon]|tara:strand:- start:1164 stop:3263 length:2100 start_codon:yes stop_codon:yes gene_type:complete